MTCYRVCALTCYCGSFLLRAPCGPDHLHALEWLYLFTDVVLEQVTGDVHQGVGEIGVFDHTGQAWVVVMGQARSQLGIVG